jgi:1-deoxy-D-xylulose-5-phosphate reductoisomerase
VLNAANEVAVEAFVNRKINFPQITETVRRTMDAHKVVSHPTLEQILEADAWARREAAPLRAASKMQFVPVISVVDSDASLPLRR